MIKITDKHKCCGCNACVQICPVKCITMIADDEGFLYPSVDESLCINCNQCNSVCPISNGHPTHPNVHSAYAAYANDGTVRYKSSSGGVFTLMSKEILKRGGVVYGAAFDNDWSVHHIAVENENEICFLRGSKYLQSRIGNSYQKALSDIQKGRFVLFSGTPCQILGLHRFLGKHIDEYNNLVTVEVVCHGAPSPGVWRNYLASLTDHPASVSEVNMRDKSRGWSKYSYRIMSDAVVLYDDYAAKSPYLRAFIDNYTLRPSCYYCPAKSNRSGADITIADCWGISGINSSFDDDKGVTLVINNTPRGDVFFSSVDGITSSPVEVQSALHSNPSYSKSSPEPADRRIFWLLYKKYGLSAINIMPRIYFLRRIISKWKQIKAKLGL